MKVWRGTNGKSWIKDKWLLGAAGVGVVLLTVEVLVGLNSKAPTLRNANAASASLTTPPPDAPSTSTSPPTTNNVARVIRVVPVTPVTRAAPPTTVVAVTPVTRVTPTTLPPVPAPTVTAVEWPDPVLACTDTTPDACDGRPPGYTVNYDALVRTATVDRPSRPSAATTFTATLPHYLSNVAVPWGPYLANGAVAPCLIQSGGTADQQVVCQLGKLPAGSDVSIEIEGTVTAEPPKGTMTASFTVTTGDGASMVTAADQVTTSVIDNPTTYHATLAEYDGLSSGATASLTYEGGLLWSGQVTASGLTAGMTYTWAVDVAEAYNSVGPVSFHRIILCRFIAPSSGIGGCTASHVMIEKRATIPPGTSTDVASTVTSVAIGPLY